MWKEYSMLPDLPIFEDNSGIYIWNTKCFNVCKYVSFFNLSGSHTKRHTPVSQVGAVDYQFDASILGVSLKEKSVS